MIDPADPVDREARSGNDRITRVTGMICLVGLAGFLAWAGLVPIAEGVTANGHVVAEQNRKVVQHLEGGIVRTLRVREGSIIKRGDTLLVLEDVRADAERAQAAQTVGALRAAVDRLTALSNNQPVLRFSSTRDLGLDRDRLAALQAEEQRVFREQRSAYLANTNVFDARRGALDVNATNKAKQIEAVRRSLAQTRSKLAVYRDLLVRQLIRRDTVEQLEREEASFEIDLARLATERADSIGQSGEVGEQTAKSRADFLASVTADLLKSRTELQAAEQALRTTNDVLARTVVRAPITGKVFNLSFNTIGGVVKPGEPIMEIVPESPSIIAQVEIRPNARDAVFKGLHVRAKLNVNKSWNAPAMEGEVIDVSGDLKTVPQSGASFYEARVLLQPTPEMLRKYPALPGMPIEAFVDSGMRRTYLSYLVEPLSDIVRRGI
jgi:HlyD family type I secretion membrane fusion protein